MMRDVENRETSVVAASIAAAVLAAIYWISRIGFANPVRPVVEALGLSLFLIAAPLWLARGIKRREWWTSQSVIAIECIAVTVLAGVIANRTGFSTSILFAAIGIILAAWTFLRWLRAGSVKSSLIFMLGAVVFSIWCAGVIWGSRYKMPLFWETLSLKANIHHDTFYYGSMANMLQTYGTPSTGLDGIPPVHYHFGSPVIFAKWADLLGLDVLSFYSLGYPIVVLPLFFSGILTFAVELRGAFGARDNPLRNDWRVWLVFLAATVGFIPTSALDALAVWNSNAFISESYLIAVPVFMFVLGAAVAAREKMPASFLFGFVPFMLAMLGFLKISLMLLGFGLLWYLALRLRDRRVIGAAIVSTLTVANAYLIVQVPAQNGGISPLHFMRYDALEGWQQFFPLIHLLWTWVYVWLRAREEKIRDWRAFTSALGSYRIIDVEVVLVIAVLGFIPGEVVSIHGGSAVYFSDVQRWLALAFIIGRMPFWVKPVSERISKGKGFSAVRLSTIAGVFIAAPFVATLFINLAQWPARVLRANLATRRELAAGHASYLPIVTALRDIARLPEAQRKQSLLFIPQSSTQYWSMFTADGRCAFTPMIAPAIASVAMLDGMPASDCPVTDQYNMPVYAWRTRPQSASDTTDQALCKRARTKGFHNVIVLDAPGRELPRRRRIDCYLL
ncbi:MAG TPA: hypothetical protein VFD22_02595 [Gemmatimonadaceae bacterium]|nr:hypothetical protein [Gemmatimonadaceae bacterium]